jgi:hypothetical protein
MTESVLVDEAESVLADDLESVLVVVFEWLRRGAPGQLDTPTAPASWMLRSNRNVHNDKESRQSDNNGLTSHRE